MRIRAAARPEIEAETVHLAAVPFLQERNVGMADVIWRLERHRVQLYRLPLFVFTAACNIGTGQTLEQIVGGAIFLNDNNDVPNSRRASLRTGTVYVYL